MTEQHVLVIEIPEPTTASPPTTQHSPERGAALGKRTSKAGGIGPVEFIDRVIRKNELGQPFSLMDHQREILRLAFAFDDDGKLPL